MFPPIGPPPGEGAAPPVPPVGLGEEEGPGAPGTTVSGCAAANCTNNEDGKCGLPEIRVSGRNECANFEGERAAPGAGRTESAEERPPGAGIAPRAPRGPMGVPPPPAKARGG